MSKIIYDDGVEMDKKKRAKVCPFCNNAQIGENAEYCKICGAELYNRCEGRAVNGEKNSTERERHINDSNARYCEICGTKTNYFIKGVLKPYSKVKDSYIFNYGTDPSEEREDPDAVIIGNTPGFTADGLMT